MSKIHKTIRFPECLLEKLNQEADTKEIGLSEAIINHLEQSFEERDFNKIEVLEICHNLCVISDDINSIGKKYSKRIRREVKKLCRLL